MGKVNKNSNANTFTPHKSLVLIQNAITLVTCLICWWYNKVLNFNTTWMFCMILFFLEIQKWHMDRKRIIKSYSGKTVEDLFLKYKLKYMITWTTKSG